MHYQKRSVINTSLNLILSYDPHPLLTLRSKVTKKWRYYFWSDYGKLALVHRWRKYIVNCKDCTKKKKHFVAENLLCLMGLVEIGLVLWHINHCRLLNTKFSLYMYIKNIWFGLVGFYGISTIIGYLIPNSLYTCILKIYDLVCLGFMAYQPS